MKKTKVAFMAALDVEAESIIEALYNAERINDAAFSITKGNFEDVEVAVIMTGVGKVNSAISTQRIIDVFKPDIIINTGIAGGVERTLKTCDIVVGSALVQYDFDLRAFNQPLGKVDGMDDVFIKSTDKVRGDLLECLKTLDINAKEGVIATGDRFVNDTDFAQFLATNFSAAACDMESGAVAQVCVVNKIPFGIVRVISDGADDDAKLSYGDFRNIAPKLTTQLFKSYLKKLSK